MRTETRPFEVEKTFGIEVLEKGGKYTFNIGMDELNRAVNATLKNHNISLMVE